MSTQAFNLSMPQKLIEQIDAQTKLRGGNRSDFIRQAVRRQLNILERWDNLASKTRSEYKGRQLTEAEIADIVRSERIKN